MTLCFIEISTFLVYCVFITKTKNINLNFPMFLYLSTTKKGTRVCSGMALFAECHRILLFVCVCVCVCGGGVYWQSQNDSYPINQALSPTDSVGESNKPGSYNNRDDFQFLQRQTDKPFFLLLSEVCSPDKFLFSLCRTWVATVWL